MPDERDGRDDQAAREPATHRSSLDMDDGLPRRGSPSDCSIDGG